MADTSFLNWPFFEERHRTLAASLDDWAAKNLCAIDHADTDNACRALVAALGQGGWLEPCAPLTVWRCNARCAHSMPDPRNARAP